MFDVVFIPFISVFATKKRARRKEKRCLERNYACVVCGAGFMSGKDLRKHEVTHTGEKPYSCHLCQQRFTSPSSRSCHIRFGRNSALGSKVLWFPNPAIHLTCTLKQCHIKKKKKVLRTNSFLEQDLL